MRKLLALSLALSSSLYFTSCKDDDSGSSKTDEELQAEVLAATQAAVDELVSIDETATGNTNESAFDGWTLAYVKGRLNTSDGIDNTPSSIEGSAPEVSVDANISANTTWYADSIYILNTRVTVLDGVTLTIEAGTIIKGNSSLSGANAAVLMIARGGKIMAEGTADAPIIMTSTDDDIQPGYLSGTTLDDTDNQKWGGLVILGKAPVSTSTDDPQIEGVDASDTNGQYGGDDADDNSGIIQYVSLRYGGAEIAEGNEINGLTLGGVGAGTTIDHVEVYANFDDAVEFFGGTVNVSNFLAYTVGDDGVDIDQNYAGTVSNFLVYIGSTSDEAMEVDGREGTDYTDDAFTLEYGTVYLVDGADNTVHADFKEKAKGSVYSVNMADGTVQIAASYDTDTYEETENAAYNVEQGLLTFTEINCAEYSVYTESFDE